MAAVIYLLHFDRPLHHARHYLGIAKDLDARVEEHRRGRGARLTAACVAAGIGFVVARVWRGKQVSRRLERQLKKQKNSRRKLCPICREAA